MSTQLPAHGVSGAAQLPPAPLEALALLELAPPMPPPLLELALPAPPPLLELALLADDAPSLLPALASCPPDAQPQRALASATEAHASPIFVPIREQRREEAGLAVDRSDDSGSSWFKLMGPSLS